VIIQGGRKTDKEDKDKGRIPGLRIGGPVARLDREGQGKAGPPLWSVIDLDAPGVEILDDGFDPGQSQSSTAALILGGITGLKDLADFGLGK
jgi:hypothetical protein